MKNISRYDFLSVTGIISAAMAIFPVHQLIKNPSKQENHMYGLVGNISAKAGQRDQLISILLQGTKDMPGCLSYIISKDAEDEDLIWVTEVWDSKEHHQASLSLPSVQDAISKGRPLIEGFGMRKETIPVGGQGIASK